MKSNISYSRIFSGKLIHTHTHVWHRGFSLLELLVVISIIGILISIGTVAYSTGQKKVRDSRRVGDLKAMQNAQEQYFAEYGSYADIGNGSVTCAGSIPGSMNVVPTDPKNIDPYRYRCASRGTPRAAWCIWSKLESSTGNCAGCASCTGEGSATTCPMAAGTTHYCVTNLQ